MDHVAGVGVGQAFRGLGDVIGGAAAFQRTFALDEVLKVLPGNVFHDDVIPVPLIVDAVRLDNVGMIQGGDGAGFGKEPLQRRPILADLPRDDLQGDATVHRRVFGEEDAAHPSPAEKVEQLVLSHEEGGKPGQQPSRLPGRDQAVPRQQLGDGRGIGQLSGDAASLGQLLICEQSALFQSGKELGRGRNRHEAPPPCPWGEIASTRIPRLV